MKIFPIADDISVLSLNLLTSHYFQEVVWVYHVSLPGMNQSQVQS